MKLTTLIILIAFMQVSAKTYSQITLHANNKPLAEVLENVKKQTGYVFFYEGHLLDNINVSIDVNNVPLKEALDRCLKDLPLTYDVVKKNVVITQKDPSILDKVRKAIAVTVTGKVTDTLGTPLIGATIADKKLNKSVITDDKGEFNISVNEGDELTISYIGYKPATIIITQNIPYLNIALHANVSGLKEVVVNTGYQSISKDKAVGSYATVDNKLFNNRVSSNIIDRLEGNVPGLIFNQNSYASSLGKTDINIDGHTTLFSNDQPLIVVDNFPFDGNINDINPNDVENVTILKDAAAAAIWGVRSGNGVIVITTKKGKRNQDLKVELNANVTIGNKPNLYYSPGFLDANDYINEEQKLFNQGIYNSSLADPSTFLSPVIQILANQKSGIVSNDQANAMLNKLRKVDVRNDLTKYFYQNSVTQQYNLNLRGGNSNSDYYFSAGEDHGLANQVGNSNNRITLKSQFNFYPTKNLELGAAVNYIKSDNTNNWSLPNSLFPYSQLADGNGNALAIPTDISSSYKATMTAQGFLNWDYKPLDELKLANNTRDVTDNIINVFANYKFFNSFKLGLSYQYQNAATKNNNDNSVDTYSTRNLINRFTTINSDGSLGYPIPLGGILNQSNSSLESQQVRLQLDYNHVFNNLHEVSVIAGSELRHQISQSDNTVFYGYDKNTNNTVSQVNFLDYYPVNPIGSSQISNGTGFYQNTYNFLSYYANAGYTYNNLYTLYVSGRIDHSNLFGVNTNQKAVPLYSVGISWNLAKEKFYNIEWLPILKPRISYGYTANIDFDATAVTTISYNNGGDFHPTNFAAIQSNGNPELRWEKNRNINIGTDFGMKNNVLSGSIDYYWKRGIDLFGYSPLPPSTGISQFFGNTASTSGNGVDVALNSNNIKSGLFRWKTNLNISFNSSKVTKYDIKSTPSAYFSTGGGASTVVPIVGAPLYSVYSFKWAGLNHDTGDPQGLVNGKPSTDYNTIVNKATLDSLQFNGPARPTTFGNLRNTFSYGAFSLSCNIIYKFNYYFRRTSTSMADPGVGLAGLGNIDYTKAWQKPGDEQFTNVPYIQYPPINYNRNYFYQNSSVLVDKGDHIRLQDISLSYDLDKSVFKSLPFNHLQIYGYVNNVGILWRANKDHLDPDLYAGSSIYYPNPRTYAIGLKANF